MSGIIAQNTLDNTGLIKSPAGGGAWNFISKLTASSSATLSFTSGIDSTYKLYLFTFNTIHPETGNTQLTFQGNVAGGSGYNETITSSTFIAFHGEDGSAATLTYDTGRDQAQGTGFQDCTGDIGDDNDQTGSGYLHLYSPSDTTFVKHFIGRASSYHPSDRENDFYFAGYFNTTSAIDEIQFKMSSDAIDSGTISLFGIT